MRRLRRLRIPPDLRRTVAIAVAVAISTAGLTVLGPWLRASSSRVAPAPAVVDGRQRPSPTASQAAAPTPAPTPTRAAARPSRAPLPPTPARLRIPAIGVDAAVESVGVTPQGNMDVPRDVDDVGWYAAGVRPGQPGDAVIDGHLDWYTGPAVFARLGRLRAGDAIEVEMGGGAVLRFRVYRLAVYANGRPPGDLFSRVGPPRLTLITCAGTWNGRSYTERLVVDAALA